MVSSIKNDSLPVTTILKLAYLATAKQVIWCLLSRTIPYQSSKKAELHYSSVNPKTKLPSYVATIIITEQVICAFFFQESFLTSQYFMIEAYFTLLGHKLPPLADKGSLCIVVNSHFCQRAPLVLLYWAYEVTIIAQQCHGKRQPC